MAVINTKEFGLRSPYNPSSSQQEFDSFSLIFNLIIIIIIRIRYSTFDTHVLKEL